MYLCKVYQKKNLVATYNILHVFGRKMHELNPKEGQIEPKQRFYLRFYNKLNHFRRKLNPFSAYFYPFLRQIEPKESQNIQSSIQSSLGRDKLNKVHCNLRLRHMRQVL